MARLIQANEDVAAKRQAYFDLRDAADGLTPETGEVGGQPQISTDGTAWTNIGISTLIHTGNGRYYGTLTQTAVATAGTVIQTRYKSANTVETPGDTFQVVAFDPDDVVALGLTRLDAAVTTRSSHDAAAVWTAGARTLTAFTFAVDLSTTALAAIWDRLTSAITTPGSIGKRIVDFLTGDAFARLGAPAGVSIAADIATRSSHTAADVDTTLTNAHGSGLWTAAGAAGGGAFSVPIHLQDDLGADVPGRTVTVRNADETVLIGGPLVTDSNGDVTFQLDAATYQILITNSGLYVPLAAQTLVVSGAMPTTTYTLTRQGLQVPSAPELCVVFGYLIQPDGQPGANVAISFQIPNAAGMETSTGQIVEVDHVVSATADSAGFFQVELVRSVNLVAHVVTQGTDYRVQSSACNIDALITVPDQDNVDLATLLP